MTDTVPTESVFEQTRGFQWREVPPGARLGRGRGGHTGPGPGGIAGFSGTFRGTGLNTIFRPQNFTTSPTPLPAPATGPDDNILELSARILEALSDPDDK